MPSRWTACPARSHDRDVRQVIETVKQSDSLPHARNVYVEDPGVGRITTRLVPLIGGPQPSFETTVPVQSRGALYDLGDSLGRAQGGIQREALAAPSPTPFLPPRSRTYSASVRRHRRPSSAVLSIYSVPGLSGTARPNSTARTSAWRASSRVAHTPRSVGRLRVLASACPNDARLCS